MHNMNDRDLVASIILGILLVLAGLLDLLYSSAVYCFLDILRHTIKHFHPLKHDLSCMFFYAVFSSIGPGL
jgi:hypothetical protein